MYIFVVSYTTTWELALLLFLGDFLYADMCISVSMLPAVRSSTECNNNQEYVAA
jgi:hypothetical protein